VSKPTDQPVKAISASGCRLPSVLGLDASVISRPVALLRAGSRAAVVLRVVVLWRAEVGSRLMAITFLLFVGASCRPLAIPETTLGETAKAMSQIDR
jgi:hypothetical protein